MTAITYKAASLIADATKADASIGGMYAKAYEQACADMVQDGATLRGLAEAVTKAGIKCSKDTAQDYIMAHSLTVHGAYYEAALAERIGEGKVMRAHSLVAKARKARGIAYVRAVLVPLREFEYVADVDAEALSKALSKAVRELDAAKPEVKAPEPTDEADEAGEDASEASEPTASESTPESKAASIITVADSLRADIVAGARLTGTARTNLMRSLVALVDAVKAADAEDAAA